MSRRFQETDPAKASAIVDRLETGTSWIETAQTFGVRPIDVARSLACVALLDETGSSLPLVQADPKRPRLQPALTAAAIPGMERASRSALAAGLLQIYDFWDESHEAAQTADDLGEADFSAYWHGIAHRREPDPGNASYWFRRVGRHPILSLIADAAGPILLAAGIDPSRFSARGLWEPNALVELARRARPGSADETLALQLQRIEMFALIEANITASFH